MRSAGGFSVASKDTLTSELWEPSSKMIDRLMHMLMLFDLYSRNVAQQSRSHGRFILALLCLHSVWTAGKCNISFHICYTSALSLAMESASSVSNSLDLLRGVRCFGRKLHFQLSRHCGMCRPIRLQLEPKQSIILCFYYQSLRSHRNTSLRSETDVASQKGVTRLRMTAGFP